MREDNPGEPPLAVLELESVMPVEQLTFTDRPRGSGFDPAAAGFQVLGCSDGLDGPARELLGSICMHYGDAVYRHAPRAALDKESRWRSSANVDDQVPAEVLSEFPVVWTYARLRDDLYALTRIRYSGITHDNRFGNFFAHTLAFAPEALGPHDHNPLAAARAEPFPSDNGGKSLRALTDLGSARGPVDLRPLTAGPVGSALPALVSALCTATTGARPVLIRIADWKQALPLLEALLTLLPPSARCRTTTCTYESDRSWAPAARGARPAGQQGAHQVLVLGGDTDRSPLRPDEIQTTYSVFNFVSGQLSPVTIRPYGGFAAACVRDNAMPRLQALQQFIERLGVGRDTDAWDTLTPTHVLFQPDAPPDSLGVALPAIAQVATQPARVTPALEAILKPVQALATTGNAAALDGLARGLAVLAERAPEGSPYLTSVQGLARDALQQGRGRTASALLAGCGPARGKMLVALLPDALNTPRGRESAEDRARRVDLLLDGVALSEAGNVSPALLLGSLEAARGAGLAGEGWKRAGPVVQSRLGDPWSADKLDLARKLLDQLPFDQCPEGNAWINLRLLAAAPPAGDELPNRLVETTRSCARTGAATKLVQDVIDAARKLLSADQPRLTLTLGRMVEAAQGTASAPALVHAYHEERSRLDERAQKSLRAELARAGAGAVLCGELFDRVLPWEDRKSEPALKEWRTLYLDPNPQLLDSIRAQLATRMEEGDARDRFRPLALQLMPAGPNETGPGVLNLTRALVARLPLEPMEERVEKALENEPANLPPETQSRLRLVRFLTRLRREADRSDWSAAKFPHDDIVWTNDLRHLQEKERDRVVEFGLRCCARAGIATPDEARSLVRVLATAGAASPEEAADAITSLLRDRDTVTRVLAGAAFSRCYLEGKPDEFWSRLVAALVVAWDRNTRKLLVDHLVHRFGPRAADHDARLRKLAQAARLPEVQADLVQGDEQAGEEKSGGILSALSSLFGRKKK